MAIKLFPTRKVLQYSDLRTTGDPKREPRDFSDAAGHANEHQAAGYEKAGKGDKPADGTLHMYSDERYAYREQDGEKWRKAKKDGQA